MKSCTLLEKADERERGQTDFDYWMKKISLGCYEEEIGSAKEEK